MYTQLYKQCNPQTLATFSNSKFLTPNSSIYYTIPQDKNVTVVNVEKTFQRPEDLKFDPIDIMWKSKINENSPYEIKSELKNPLPQQETVIENYPVECKRCTSGSVKIPGVTWYDSHNVEIMKDIKEFPESCNPKIKNTNQIENFSNVKSPMSREVWGPKAWDFLHTVTFGFPDNPTEKEKQDALNFFNSLPTMLPCKICSEHCRNNIRKIPPNVNSKKDLSMWLVNLHNEVNKQLGKGKIYTYSEISKKYMGIAYCN